ncbi:MAG: response regulator [Chloroflexi bacterium]|nr:response regulator [Chloroflexota bacterium]
MRKRVLAVDDDERLRRLLRVNLESQDIEVTEVGTGEECLRLVQEGEVALVLLDLNLPDCSGWDVLATLRQMDRPRSIPVIVLSVVPPDKIMIERWKPNQYLQKPFDARDLPGLVQRVLDEDELGSSQSL